MVQRKCQELIMVNFLSVGLVLIATFIGAIATLLIKKSTINKTWKKTLFSSLLWTGLFLYGLSVLIYFSVLRNEELSIIYPLVSTTYIWTTLFSVKFLKEKMDPWKWTALVGIIIGIVLIGIGS